MRYATAIILICVLGGCSSAYPKKAKSCVGDFRPVNSMTAAEIESKKGDVKCEIGGQNV